MKGARLIGGLAALLALAFGLLWLVGRPGGDSGIDEAAAPEASAGATPEGDARPPVAATRDEARREATSPASGGAVAARVEQETGTLEVEVVWAALGTPAHSIGVRAHYVDSAAPHALWREARSDASGIARLEAIPQGRVRVVGDRSGEVEATVTSDARTRVRLVLDEGRVVRGRTVDAAGQTVANAELWLLRPGERDAQQVGEGDAMGTFQVPGAPEGARLFARHRERSPSAPWLVPGPGAANVEVRLSLGLSGALVLGQVVDGEDQPIRGAAVALEPRAQVAGEPAPRATAVTDDEGRFQFAGAEPALSRLMVLHPDAAPYHEELAVVPGGRIERIVRLARGVRLSGTVRREDKSPVAGAEVTLEAPAPWLELRTRTSDSGTYELRGVPTGRIRVRLGSSALVVEVPSVFVHTWNPVLRGE